MADSFIEPTKLSTLKHIIEVLERRADELGADPKEMDVGFELVVGSCFPKVWNNMQAHLNQTYMNGYIQGREDVLKEGENES